MASVVADTHAALWHLGRDARLSTVARDALRESIQAGDPIFVASISVVEITYLVEKGRLPESALQTLRAALADPTFGLVPVALDLRVADAIRRISRDSVPDLPDRVIAATALSLKTEPIGQLGGLRLPPGGRLDTSSQLSNESARRWTLRGGP
jgi:PIN domain nuclease of toxin-antitoxin system